MLASVTPAATHHEADEHETVCQFVAVELPFVNATVLQAPLRYSRMALAFTVARELPCPTATQKLVVGQLTLSSRLTLGTVTVVAVVEALIAEAVIVEAPTGGASPTTMAPATMVPARRVAAARSVVRRMAMVRVDRGMGRHFCNRLR
jgi:hypothetical protein